MSEPRTFEDHLKAWTGRDLDFHVRAGATGIEFGRSCWEASDKATRAALLAEPRTPLGRKLLEHRNAAMDKGMKPMSAGELKMQNEDYAEGWNDSRAALLADRPDVAELCAWHRRNLCPLFKDNGSCDPSGECSCSMRERIVSTLESLAAQLAEKTAAHKALFERLAPSVEYVEGTPVGYGEDEIDRLRAQLSASQAKLSEVGAERDTLIKAGDASPSLLMALLKELLEQARARESVEAALDALKEDAERYRWLRNPYTLGRGMVSIWSAADHKYEYRNGGDLDAALDAARKK